jgi:hypothetical protein
MNPYAAPLTRPQTTRLGWSLVFFLPVVFVALTAVTYTRAAVLYKHGYEVISVIPAAKPVVLPRGKGSATIQQSSRRQLWYFLFRGKKPKV